MAPVTREAAQSEPSVFSEAAGSALPSSAGEIPTFAADRQQTRDWLREIEESLERKTQLPTTLAARADRMYLKPLVALANIENPGLNAYAVGNWNDDGGDWPSFRATVEKLMQDGTQSARFVVALQSPPHVGAADYRRVGDKVSIILVEPTRMDFAPAGQLHSLLLCQFGSNPRIAFTTIEADIQNSPTGCAMLSFFLMKKMFKEQSYFQTLHEQNVAGTLATDAFGVVQPAAADFVLPPSFMKHAQSKRRLNRYLQAQPEMAAHPINGRGETLLQRWARGEITGTKSDGTVVTYNRAIEEKRRDYIAQLLEMPSARG